MLSLGAKLTPEQRLQKATSDIMGHERYAALGGVLMIGESGIKEDADCPTAYTNGKDCYYGRSFVEGLTDAQLRFLVLHENFHKMYRHLITWQHLRKKCATTANVAMDYVINAEIVNENSDGFATMIDGGCHDPKYLGWDTAKVFNDIYDGQDKPKNDPRGKPNDDDDGESTNFDEHGWDEAEDMTPEEQNELEREIDENLRQGEITAGKLGNGAKRDLSEILSPPVNWREVLKQFTYSNCSGSDYSTYAKRNRRFIDEDIIRPSGVSDTIDGIVVGGDMSGSIGNREQSIIKGGVKDCAEMVRPQWLRMLYWDTRVVGDETYTIDELDDFVSRTKPVGGGGTDVECVPKYIEDKKITPQAAIIITDGDLYRGWGKWDCPVLWVIIDNKHATPNVGQVVHVNSKDL
jgi:predicted metal-dependent peptidase